MLLLEFLLAKAAIALQNQILVQEMGKCSDSD